MTQFIPHAGFLVHAKKKFHSDSEANKALLEAQKEVFDGSLEVYPLGDQPVTVKPVNERRGYEYGPVQPEGICPVTGRILRLIPFRDLTCVIIRQSTTAGEWEMLPSSVHMHSQIYNKEHMDGPYEDRHSSPTIKMMSTPQGLAWTCQGCVINEVNLLKMIRPEISRLAGEILSRGPVYDPRVTQYLPEGGRFDQAQHFVEIKNEWNEVISAIGRLRAIAYNSINSQKKWGTIQIDPYIGCPEQGPRMSLSISLSRNKERRALKRIARQNINDLVEAMPHNLMTVRYRQFTLEPPQSAHELMQLRVLLRQMERELPPEEIPQTEAA